MALVGLRSGDLAGLLEKHQSSLTRWLNRGLKQEAQMGATFTFVDLWSFRWVPPIIQASSRKLDPPASAWVNPVSAWRFLTLQTNLQQCVNAKGGTLPLLRGRSYFVPVVRTAGRTSGMERSRPGCGTAPRFTIHQPPCLVQGWLRSSRRAKANFRAVSPLVRYALASPSAW